MQVEYATVLHSRHVRAAHIYIAVFECVKENFAIAGLLSLVDVNIVAHCKMRIDELSCILLFQRFLNFYGVYYQNVMARLQRMDNIESETFIEPIQEYRIYVEKF